MTHRTFLCTNGLVGAALLTLAMPLSALAGGGSDCCLANGTPGCDDPDCEAAVCAVDSFCCDVAWDTICAGEAADLCGDLCAGAGQCGDPASGDCCVANGTPGCDNLECCEAVCAIDPFCCDTSWDGICAGEAIATCGAEVCPPPDCPESDHDCYTVGVPGCTDVECCQSVCALDSFCCEVQWDGICVQEAFDLCGLPDCPFECPEGATDEGEPCGDDLNGGCNVPIIGDSNCCFANGGVGCDDPVCEKAVCSVDPFCCDVAWDGICAAEALDFCPDTCAQGKPQFGSISCGETICGTAWADGGLRDTDWYEIEITEATEITFSATTTGPLVIGIVDTGGIPDCGLATALNPFATAPFCGTASFTACLGPGTYWFFAASSQFEGFPCSAGGCNGCPDFNADGNVDGADLGLLLGAWGPGGECFDLNDDGGVDGADLGLLLGAWGPATCTPGSGNDNTRYSITLECGGKCVPPACGVEGTGDCFKANGTPFCDDAECCEIVCGIDPFCCDVAWDGICADEAFQFCIVVELECEPGATEEAEACGDDTNGGCNMAEPTFEPTECGAVICGTAWADGIRDTDWFELVLDTDTEVTFEGVAEFPLVIGVVDTGGVPDCGLATALNPFATANPGQIASFTACLPAGTHWLFVAPSVFGGYPCDSGNNLYNVFITCGGDCVPPACGGEGSGDCFEANGTPFCDDNCAGVPCEGCCNLICSLDPFCCDVAWDGICADEALQNCGEIEPLLNDTCEDAVANDVTIAEGITEFSTLGATTGGPALPAECDKGFGLAFVSDVWFVYTPTCSGLVTVSTCDSASFDTRLAAYVGGCDALELVGCNDDGPGCTGFTSIMEFEAVCGETYFIRLGGFGGAGTGTVTVTCDGAGCP